MTSLQRILTTCEHKEPDRVPFFIPATLRGAKERGVSIKDFFSNAENVVETQLRLLNRYQHDCVLNFFYAAIEVEAWGMEVLFFEDGPPNAAKPFITKPEDIKRLKSPKIAASGCLTKVLKATEMLRNKAGDVPVMGVVISPFSLPVMQMGFDKYLDLMYEQTELFWQLMRVNEEFCVEWANAQLRAGATMIIYYDPVSSTTIIPKKLYLKTGFEIAKKTLARINGTVITHMASGRCLSIVDEIAQTGTISVVTSVLEDLAEMKAACKGKLTVMGNLNTIEMCRWTPQQAEIAVKDAIAKAGPGGGYILSDNHSEIPLQVPEDVLTAISEAVHRWGRYPLDWVKDYGK